MSTVKEIVLISQYIGNAGAERVMSILAGKWAEKGIHVNIIQTRPFLGSIEYRLDNDINIINMRFKKGIFWRFFQFIDFYQIMKNHSDAIVINFLNPGSFLSGLGTFFLSNKFLFTERNNPDKSPPKKIYRKIRDLFFELADICVFQTEQAKQHFSKRVQAKGYIIPNPINPELPEPYEGERKKVIIAVARLEKQKNLLMLINAFSLFHENHPEYSLEIYGRGSLEMELNDLISAKDLRDSVHLMGFSDDIYSKMRECAMYVSSSDYEGISNSMIEAMGLGLPTICTDCPVGGARKTIINGVNGLLVPVGDVQSLYEAMCKIADNPELAEKLSGNAVKIREDLSADRIAQQWLDVMEKI